MNISVCLNPKIITNRYTGEKLTVRCGKCAYCRNLKASQWIQRIEQESLCHKYTVFFTLTYNNDFVPNYHFDIESDALIHDDEIVSISDIRLSGCLDKNSSLYILKRLDIPFLSKIDLQNFIKRLRYNFNKYIPDDENKQLRYYAVGEYGSTTYRPHYHGLLWFESPTANKEIKKILSESWSFGKRGQKNEHNKPLGIIDCSNVCSSASEYVARYVNSVSNLPRLYQFKDFRPFSLFSRHPGIGTLPYKDEFLQEIIDHEINEIRVFDKKSSKYKYIPLWRSLEDRLFPRFPKFSKVSCLDGISLYDFYLSTDSETFRTFKSSVANFCLTSKDLDMITYLRSICEYSTVTLSGLYHFYLTCKRIEHNSKTFGYSAPQYISKIFMYYDKKKLSSLSAYFEFKEHYLKEHLGQTKHLLMMDEIFYRSLRNYANMDAIPEDTFDILDFYDCIFDDFDESPKVIQDYRDNFFINNKIFRASLKTKKKNEYINIIRYNKNYSWLFKHY